MKFLALTLYLLARITLTLMTATGLEPTTTYFVNEHTLSCVVGTYLHGADKCADKCGFTLKRVRDMIRTYRLTLIFCYY